MSAKPTPGPYTIHDREPARHGNGFGEVTVRSGNHNTFASFPYYLKNAKALANARAWVDGIAALEKLERLTPLFRKIVENAEHQRYCQSCADGDYCPGILEGIEEARKILDEAKP